MYYPQSESDEADFDMSISLPLPECPQMIHTSGFNPKRYPRHLWGQATCTLPHIDALDTILKASCLISATAELKKYKLI